MSGRHDVLFFPSSGVRSGPVPATTQFRLAVVGNYPPRRCGIATFTADMVEALTGAAPEAAVDIYAMTRDPQVRPEAGVSHLVVEDDRASYREAGLVIERSRADAVWVQHEFGIFGGDAGEWLIDLLAPIAAPIVVTLHTVLAEPTPAQERVMAWLVAHASRIVVMSERGAAILGRRADVRPEQVVVIEHGAPDRPFGRSAAMKRQLGLGDGPVLMTFGLLSRGKGLEAGITALADILPRFPTVSYVIAGATHPNIVAREGEAYRDSLKELAASLGVADNIRWEDRYLDTPELLDLIEAADIYLTPYLGAAQSTSGTLAYAVALGKAVVSTPYAHAEELLADGNGVLTPFGDTASLAGEIARLLADPAGLEALQRRAYQRGRSTIWSNFGRRTRAVIEQVRVERRPRAAPLPASHADLERLCDDTGMVQHSVLSVPDRAHGYCVDDNVRALMFANVSGGRFAARATTFAAFIQHSWNPGLRSFRNFMGFDRRWCEDAGSQDSCGRTLWSLGSTSRDGATADVRVWADKLWRESAGIAHEFTAIRATAFAMLGADRRLDAMPDDPLALKILTEGAERLGDALERESRAGWRWFEPVLAYDNCRLPQALLAAARRLGDKALAQAAVEALEWIVVQQTAPEGHYRPVGSEGFGTGDLPPVPFDQQPVDAWATVDAAASAFRHEGGEHWLHVAERAYAWFFGANDRGLALADSETGACHDGLTPRGINLNRGAESVLALHLAGHTMRQLRVDASVSGRAVSERTPQRDALPLLPA